jgi:hypothetical protein
MNSSSSVHSCANPAQVESSGTPWHAGVVVVSVRLVAVVVVVADMVVVVVLSVAVVTVVKMHVLHSTGQSSCVCCWSPSSSLVHDASNEACNEHTSGSETPLQVQALQSTGHCLRVRCRIISSSSVHSCANPAQLGSSGTPWHAGVVVVSVRLVAVVVVVVVVVVGVHSPNFHCWFVAFHTPSC